MRSKISAGSVGECVCARSKISAGSVNEYVCVCAARLVQGRWVSVRVRSKISAGSVGVGPYFNIYIIISLFL